MHHIASCCPLISKAFCDMSWNCTHTASANARNSQRHRCESTALTRRSVSAYAGIGPAETARLYCQTAGRSIRGRCDAGKMGDQNAFDVALLQNLQIGKSRRKTAGTSSVKPPGKSMSGAPSASRRSTRNQTEQDILRHVQGSVLQKYCSLCVCLNVDPMDPKTLGLVMILLSRHAQRIEIARNFMLIERCDVSHVAWNTAEGLDFLQQKMSSSSDWSVLLGYVVFELTEPARAELGAHPVLCSLQQSLLQAGITTSHTPLEFVMLSLLYMTPAGTPSPKMLERFLSHQSVECRDVEVKCLRAVTSFNDSSSNEGLAASCLLHICQWVVALPAFALDLQDVLTAQNSDSAKPAPECVRRIRLRDIVDRVHQASALSYELSFDSWCSQKKFATTTGLNVQRLLYFINAQTTPVDFGLFPDYFTPAMTSHLALQELSTIDIAPINAVIASLRVYTNNIKHLIDFRAQCLDGLNVKARQELSQAQILQLYVCCFQHESIRDRCWRAVLPVLNHSIQRACVVFREKFPFEVEAVLRSVILCHVKHAPAALSDPRAAAL